MRIFALSSFSLAIVILALTVGAPAPGAAVIFRDGSHLAKEKAERPALHGDGPVYYVSPEGDDKAAGTSPATAWKTVAKVNRGPFREATAKLHNGPDATWDKATYDKLQAIK